jgi:hypothetical protein
MGSCGGKGGKKAVYLESQLLVFGRKDSPHQSSDGKFPYLLHVDSKGRAQILIKYMYNRERRMQDEGCKKH